jgi:hypothetical protein
MTPKTRVGMRSAVEVAGGAVPYGWVMMREQCDVALLEVIDQRDLVDRLASRRRRARRRKLAPS